MLTIDQKRAKLRAELTKELLGSPTEKRDDKSKVAIHKGTSKKAKFLANPNNRIEPNEQKLGRKMDKCPNVKTLQKNRESGITIAKVMGDEQK